GETHIIPPIVIPAPRDYTVRILDIHFPLQKIEGILSNMLIVNKTDGIANFPMLNTGRYFFYNTLAQIIVDIQFGIPGNLDHMGRNGFIIEHIKNTSQTISDEVVQYNDIVSIPFFGQDHKTIDPLWDLYKGIAPLLGTGPVSRLFLKDQLYRQIGGRIL